jgi:O-phosphoseryl-tRNA(Cys) synthetase
MKKDEKILSQEMIDYCERAIEESKKLCDEILDSYKGNLEQKEFLKELSKMMEIDNMIKEKINNLSFSDIKNDNNILDEIDEMLKRKFNILDFLNFTDEKQLV